MLKEHPVCVGGLPMFKDSKHVFLNLKKYSSEVKNFA